MTPWTVVYEVPPWNFPGKSTTRMGFHFLHALIVGKIIYCGVNFIMYTVKTLLRYVCEEITEERPLIRNSRFSVMDKTGLLPFGEGINLILFICRQLQYIMLKGMLLLFWY